MTGIAVARKCGQKACAVSLAKILAPETCGDKADFLWIKFTTANSKFIRAILAFFRIAFPFGMFGVAVSFFTQ